METTNTNNPYKNNNKITYMNQFLTVTDLKSKKDKEKVIFCIL